MQQTVNLAEKTTDELKIMGWDLMTMVDESSRMLRVIAGEIANRERKPAGQPTPAEPES